MLFTYHFMKYLHIFIYYAPCFHITGSTHAPQRFEEYNVYKALSSTSPISNIDCGQYTISFVLCTTIKKRT